MADERIVIEILQRFTSANYRGAIRELTDHRAALRNTGTAQRKLSDDTRAQLVAISALHPEIRKTTQALVRYSREIERNDGLSEKQLINFEKRVQELRDWSKGLSDAQREVYGLDRAERELDHTHVKVSKSTADANTQTIRLKKSVKDLADGVKELSRNNRESSDFTDQNTGAMRRFARQVDRYTATTGRRAINGWRQWATTIATILPSSLPMALSLVGQAVDTLTAIVLEGAAAFRSLSGGVGAFGGILTGVLQAVGAFKLGLGSLGTTSQSFGKVIGQSLSESGAQFLTMLKTLSPQAARFAVTLRAQVFPVLHKWRMEMQSIFFPALEIGFKNMKPLLAPLHGAFREMGIAMADAIRNVTHELGGREWQQFIKFQGGENVRNFRTLAQGISPVSEALRNLITAAAPVTRLLADLGLQAEKAFSRFVNARAATGQLGQDALTARDSLKLFVDLLKNTAQAIGGVLRVAQPFGIAMTKSLNEAAKAADRWTHSFRGQQEMKKFFTDLQPNIRATARLFTAFVGVILRQAANPGMAKFFDNLRTQFLPALEQVMNAVSRGLTGTALVDIFSNLAEILAKLTGPESPAFLFLEFLNGFTKLVSVLPRQLLSMVFGFVALWRVLRLIGVIKLARWWFDMTGRSDAISKSLARMDRSFAGTDNALQASANRQRNIFNKMASGPKILIQEYRLLRNEMKLTAEAVAQSSATMAAAARGGTSAGARQMIAPLNIAGRPITGVRGSVIDEPQPFTNRAGLPVTAAYIAQQTQEKGRAQTSDYRLFLRSHGYTHVEGRPLSDARLNAVKAEAERLIFATAVGGFIAGEQKATRAVQSGRPRVMGAGAVAPPPAGRASWRYPGTTAYQNYVAPIYAPGTMMGDVRAGYQTGGLRGAGSSLFQRMRPNLGMAATFGVPFGLLMGSSMTQNKTASRFMGNIGTGALLGASFGPEGALVGGLAGLALSLRNSSKHVDAMANAMRRGTDAARNFAAGLRMRPLLRQQVAVAGVGVRDTRKQLDTAKLAVEEFRGRAKELRPGITEEQLKHLTAYRDLLDNVTLAQAAYNDSVRALNDAKKQQRDQEARDGRAFRASVKQLETMREIALKAFQDMHISGKNAWDDLNKGAQNFITRQASAFTSQAANFAHHHLPGLARVSAAYALLIKQLGRMPTPKEIKIALRLDSVSVELIQALRRAGFLKQSAALAIDLHHHPSRRRGGFAGRFRGGGFFIPGQPVAADNQLVMASPGELFVTHDGQQMMEQAAPGLVDRIVAQQRPHFNAGGFVKKARPTLRRFASGGSVPLPPIPGETEATAASAASAGFSAGSTPGALGEFVRGIYGQGIFEAESGSGLFDLSGVPFAKRSALRRMHRKADAISKTGGPLIDDKGIIYPLRKRDSGQIQGLVGEQQIPGWGYTLASAITGILRAGGIKVPIAAKTSGLLGMGPVGHKGDYLSLLTKPRIAGTAGAALQILRQAFGASSRSDAITGTPTGLGWLSNVPSGSEYNRRTWPGFRRGGRLGRFRYGGGVGTAGGSYGMISPGNIDVSNLPGVKNPDGSISTVRSISFNDGGREVLIPTVINGHVVSNQEAIRQYRRRHKHLGIFSSAGAANHYARQLHAQQARMVHERNLRLIRMYQNDPLPKMKRPGIRTVASGLDQIVGAGIGVRPSQMPRNIYGNIASVIPGTHQHSRAQRGLDPITGRPAGVSIGVVPFGPFRGGSGIGGGQLAREAEQYLEFYRIARAQPKPVVRAKISGMATGSGERLAGEAQKYLDFFRIARPVGRGPKWSAAVFPRQARVGQRVRQLEHYVKEGHEEILMPGWEGIVRSVSPPSMRTPGGRVVVRTDSGADYPLGGPWRVEVLRSAREGLSRRRTTPPKEIAERQKMMLNRFHEARMRRRAFFRGRLGQGFMDVDEIFGQGGIRNAPHGRPGEYVKKLLKQDEQPYFGPAGTARFAKDFGQLIARAERPRTPPSMSRSPRPLRGTSGKLLRPGDARYKNLMEQDRAYARALKKFIARIAPGRTFAPVVNARMRDGQVLRSMDGRARVPRGTTAPNYDRMLSMELNKRLAASQRNALGRLKKRFGAGSDVGRLVDRYMGLGEGDDILVKMRAALRSSSEMRRHGKINEQEYKALRFLVQSLSEARSRTEQTYVRDLLQRQYKPQPFSSNRRGGMVQRFGLGGFLRHAPGAVFDPVKSLGRKIWKGNLKQIAYEKHRNLTYAYQDRGLGWKEAGWLADIMLGPHPLRKQSMAGRGHSHRRGGIIRRGIQRFAGGGIVRRIQRFAGGGVVAGIGQTGVGDAANNAYTLALARLTMSLQNASFGFIVTLINGFKAMIRGVEAQLRAAIMRGAPARIRKPLERQLARLQVGLQTVEFAAEQRIGALNEKVQKIMDRVGRFDATTLTGIAKQAKLTNKAIRIMLRAIKMAIAAGAPKEIMDQLKDQLQAVRDARREQIRSVYSTRVAIAGFKEQQQSLGLQKLELQQRLAGTFETGGAQRASFITSNIVPALQKELKELQLQLKKGKLTGEERRQQQLAIQAKQNEILQAQLDAQEAIKANTAAVAAKLTGNLSFEFGGQTNTDLVGAGTGV